MPATVTGPIRRLPSVPFALGVWFAAALGMAIASTTTHLLASGLNRSHPGERGFADPEQSPLLHQPTWIALGTVANELTVLVIVIGAIWIYKADLRSVAPMMPTRHRAWLGAVLLAVGLGPFAELAGGLVRQLLDERITVAEVVIAAARESSLLQFAAVLVCLAALPAIVEELMFRGLITAAFLSRSRVLGVVFPSLLFGAFHFEPTQVAGTVVLGFAFGVARVMTGSLLPGIVAHAVYNALVLFVVRYGDPDPTRSVPATQLLIAVPIAALGAYLLRQSRPVTDPASSGIVNQ